MERTFCLMCLSVGEGQSRKEEGPLKGETMATVPLHICQCHKVTSAFYGENVLTGIN